MKIDVNSLIAQETICYTKELALKPQWHNIQVLINQH